MKTDMTPDQERLLGGPERVAAIRRRIASEGSDTLMSASHVVYAASAVHDDNDDDLDENSTAPQLVNAAQRHLAKFLAAPDAEDGGDHLGYANALLSTALSRVARTAQASLQRRRR